MSDVADDVFETAMALKIDNPSLNVAVVIHPSFMKQLDDDTYFVSLRFWNSRGIENLLTCRLPPRPQRHYNKLLANVLSKLKKARDESFRQLVELQSPDSNIVFHRKAGGVKPRTRAGQAAALSITGVIDVEVPAFAPEFEGFRLSCCFESLDRSNRNSDIWVASQSTTWNYLSKLVLHDFEAESESPAPVDLPTTPASTAKTSTTSPVPAPTDESATSPIATSPTKRLSFGAGTESGESATPLKKADDAVRVRQAAVDHRSVRRC